MKDSLIFLFFSSTSSSLLSSTRCISPLGVNNLSNAMSFLCQESSTLFFSHAREINKYKFNAKQKKNKNAEKTAMIQFQSFSPPVVTGATLQALDGTVLLPLPPRAF
jgi:hypothetical protein